MLLDWLLFFLLSKLTFWRDEDFLDEEKFTDVMYRVELLNLDRAVLFELKQAHERK